MISIQRLHKLSDQHIDQLASVLQDCVDGGASVSFMHPFTRERAVSFWHMVAKEVLEEHRILLVAEDNQGICGTVQLVQAQPENQPHRADVAKLLVHRRARCNGVASRLMQAAESIAQECGKTLLVLDTVTDSAASRVYDRLGWIRVGDIPKYALWPEGGYCSTTVYYRDLQPHQTTD